ncbi:hypothetical protein Q5752_005996 [Cryptotrichosporon argae]
MPIDADAYMAGHIPGLSRGGSWLPSTHPVAAYGALSSPVPKTASTLPTSFGVLYKAHATAPHNTPRTLTPARAHHHGWAALARPGQSRSGSRSPLLLAPSHASPSPHKPSGTTPPPPPPPRAVFISSRSYRLGNAHWAGGSWEAGSGAPKRISVESDYASTIERDAARSRERAEDTRQRADTLPPAASDTAHTRARHKSASQARGGESGTPRTQPRPGPRPALPRRHTHEPPPRVPSRMSQTDAPSAYSDQSDLGTALPRGPPGYIAPFSEEGYDRYTAHPAARAQPHAERELVRSAMPDDQTTVSSHGAAQRTAAPKGGYVPVGYADKPRQMPPVDRAGPLMRTHGVPWSSETVPLPLEPEGPRWAQARPPRPEIVEGGAWGQAGGQGW